MDGLKERLDLFLAPLPKSLSNSCPTLCNGLCGLLVILSNGCNSTPWDDYKFIRTPEYFELIKGKIILQAPLCLIEVSGDKPANSSV
jgi:hypothetical protein